MASINTSRLSPWRRQRVCNRSIRPDSSRKVLRLVEKSSSGDSGICMSICPDFKGSTCPEFSSWGVEVKTSIYLEVCMSRCWDIGDLRDESQRQVGLGATSVFDGLLNVPAPRIRVFNLVQQSTVVEPGNLSSKLLDNCIIGPRLRKRPHIHEVRA